MLDPGRVAVIVLVVRRIGFALMHSHRPRHQ